MPPRIPKAVKQARGEPQPMREPKPIAVAPPGSRWIVPDSPPEGSCLDVAAWSACAAAVNERGCATLADKLAFTQMVRALALLWRAEAELTAAGFTYTTESGARKASPAVSAWATASKTAGALMDRFGLSPSMRERVASVPSAAEHGRDTAAERFLFGNVATPLPGAGK